MTPKPQYIFDGDGNKWQLDIQRNGFSVRIAAMRKQGSGRIYSHMPAGNEIVLMAEYDFPPIAAEKESGQ